MKDNINKNSTSNSVNYKDTLNLPRTDFPIRHVSSKDDPEMLARWGADDLYGKSSRVNSESSKRFFLHMGPPYANGNIHLGHSFTTILKDIIAKSYRMAGYYSPVFPGWDCHGLPIEITLSQKQSNLSRLEFKKACREYAQGWVDVQREEFKRLGILMDWEKSYLTMSPGYESSILRFFGLLLEKGFIDRKERTVPWCFSCETVLASAEIEYEDREDPSIYVKFKILADDLALVFPKLSGREVSFLVWTTTPWTLPLNRAVALKSDSEYLLVDLGGELVIFGASLLGSIERLVGKKGKVVKKFFGDILSDVRVLHPFDPGRYVPVIFNEKVSVSEGTACVHIAPGCGPEDYGLGIREGLEIYSPLGPDGRYIEGIVPKDLAGVSIVEARGNILDRLRSGGSLFACGTVNHSYPHCWRCHKGLMFRATKQWFFNLEHDNVRQRVLDEIDNKLEFSPVQGRNFLRSTVSSRLEWCLSRQKVWGVPIPALLCRECGREFINAKFVERVASFVEQEGIEYWDRVAVYELLGERCVSCSGCGSSNFEKNLDILDVWFDAGVSHYAVLRKSFDLDFPADLYLEAVDQHRGWFQSSLLTALAVEGVSPMRCIMTHGFTVDDKGRKMSKSLGNVVSPMDIVDRLGTDGLRLWVSSISREGDIIISETILKNIGEVFRKVRNTLRFLLANLYDFDGKINRLPLDDLLPVDQIILAHLFDLNKLVIKSYHSGDMTAVFHSISDFCVVRLSSWYLDIVKDRLYVEKSDGDLRRSAQTACWYLLDTLTRLVAPVMSFTAEQVSDFYQREKLESIHLQSFSDLPDVRDLCALRLVKEGKIVVDGGDCKAYLKYLDSVWSLLEELRGKVLKLVEIEREKGVIKHSLEASVNILAKSKSPSLKVLREWSSGDVSNVSDLESFLEELFIVSRVRVRDFEDFTNDAEDFKIEISRVSGNKCPRCWKWHDSVEDLCGRCKKVISS